MPTRENGDAGDRPIFLTGFMACGKTTLCRAVASRLDADSRYRFYDLDDEVERAAGMSVGEIFRQRGEAAFRRMESATLRRLAGEPYAVIACGGGTPCHDGNMELMNTLGTTVFLEASSERIVRRLLEAPRGQRPLADGYSDAESLRCFVATRLSERMPYYSLCRYRFDTTALDTPEEVERTSRSFIKQFLCV